MSVDDRGACGSCDERLTPENSSRLRTGKVVHIGCPGKAALPVCPRCLGVEPGKPSGDPAKPHPGPFTTDLCEACEKVTADRSAVPTRAAKKKPRLSISLGVKPSSPDLTGSAAPVVPIPTVRPSDEIVEPPPLPPDPPRLQLGGVRRAKPVVEGPPAGPVIDEAQVTVAACVLGFLTGLFRLQCEADDEEESDPVEDLLEAAEAVRVSEEGEKVLEAAVDVLTSSPSRIALSTAQVAEMKRLQANPPHHYTGACESHHERERGERIHIFDRRYTASGMPLEALCGAVVPFEEGWKLEYTVLTSKVPPERACEACRGRAKDLSDAGRGTGLAPAWVKPGQILPGADRGSIRGPHEEWASRPRGAGRGSGPF